MPTLMYWFGVIFGFGTGYVWHFSSAATLGFGLVTLCVWLGLLLSKSFSDQSKENQNDSL